MLGFSWKLMYSGFSSWWFLDGIHIIFLWRIIDLILWQILISVGVIVFMGVMIFMIFLITLMLTFLRVFTCSIILVFGLLMFDVKLILIISLLVHYFYLRKLVHSWNFLLSYLTGFHFWLYEVSRGIRLSARPIWLTQSMTDNVIGKEVQIWCVILHPVQR